MESFHAWSTFEFRGNDPPPQSLDWRLSQSTARAARILEPQRG